MFVCHCAVVTDGDVARCIAAGARTLADVCRATRAGQGCGGCVGAVRELLCQHCPSVAERRPVRGLRATQEVAGAAV